MKLICSLLMQDKGKFVHFQAMMAYRVSRCIASLILNLGTRRWVVTIFYKIFMCIVECCLFCGWRRCVDIGNKALPLSFID